MENTFYLTNSFRNAAGASLAQAAQYVGCSVDTIRREQKRNEDFGERFRRATASAQLAPLQAMRQAVQTHWRAAAWMLERADPEHFGSQKQHFGAKELRALRRDLIDVFEEEIDIPIVRDRVVRRVKATIDYAMRHAWDKQRSGGKLREAMKFFEQRESSSSFDDPENLFSDPWNPMDAVMAEIRLMAGTAGAQRDEQTNQHCDNPQEAITVPFCKTKHGDDPKFAERNSTRGPQKG